MRAFNYLVIIVGLMMMYNFIGIDTTSSYVLRTLGVTNPESIPLTSFVATIVGIFAAALVGGIVIGSITKSSPESYLLAGYASTLTFFVSDMIFVVSYMHTHYAGWMAYLLTLIVIPLAVGFLHSIVSWWGGRD